MAKQFESHVRTQGSSVVIDLQGEIDGAAEAVLNAGYADAEQRDPGTIVLNFQAVDYMNSTGIALIVGLLARARKSHRNLVVFGLSQHYQEIFQITRLSDYMKIFSDERSALAG